MGTFPGKGGSSSKASSSSSLCFSKWWSCGVAIGHSSVVMLAGGAIAAGPIWVSVVCAMIDYDEAGLGTEVYNQLIEYLEIFW